MNRARSHHADGVFTRLVTALTILTASGLLQTSGAVGLPIQIDGDYSDWNEDAVLGTDPSGDDGSSGIDFTFLQVADDGDWAYVRFDLTVDVQGDEGQSLRFALDTDQNPATGLSVGGIGAELVWRLGDRTGNVYPSGTQVDQASLGIVLAPTVSDTQLEFALSRQATPAGTSLFPGAAFSIYVWDDANGDAIGPFDYTFSGDTQPVDSRSLDREDPLQFRLASYNIENDGLFDGGARAAAFQRIFGAVDPDVWVLCEIWNHDAAETEARVEQFLPSPSGESWHALKRDQGNVIVSRYPILDSWDVLPGSRLTAALLDLRPDFDTDLLVIANHWSCCTADDNRQEQADALISFLRDARTSGGVIDLAPDTPILAAGDFNLVGWRRQLETLTTGDIVDEGTFGPDSPPDWDGSEFDRAEVRHPDTRFVYTWRNDGGSFYPGQLDYIWFTGSVATLHRSLTVETRTMLSSSLAEFGLGAGDTETASDHAAVFADFSFDDTSSVEHLPISGEPRLSWLAARPNPFLGSTDLRFELETSATVSVSIYDVSGREVRRLVDGDRLDAGPHGYHWDGTDSDGRQVPAGAYVYEVRAEGEVLGSTLVRLH
ncbi:MAG: endonuclease/exonuclease/phosphatase family protein [Candidatus Eisenbacteria bacterium]|nr:endonuclease/exonuclease/phosphatase family protein [Candidatus Eisenbacteria bacterium]